LKRVVVAARRTSIRPAAFRIPARAKVDLTRRPTRIAPLYGTKAEYEALIGAHAARLNELQSLHYASARYAVLVIFQGMDAAGKDGAIGHVMSGVNPEGCEVYGFKQPSAEELKHDFLWRSTCRLPERGRIGIFNRSYYEEVLITRVHPEMLEAENLPLKAEGDRHFWRDRYRSIVDFEEHLYRSGTRIVKFFLHLSKQEQASRFLERIHVPDKNWKLSTADMHERLYWNQYTQAYAECLSATSTPHAPWYAVPADDKETARLIMSQILLDVMAKLPMAYPATTAKRRRELATIAKALGQVRARGE
jgi:PPK2 family polyphosphate:nucleotide phosphotransferase